MEGIVLLSGGLDSVVSLAFARQTIDIKYALTFDYGQKAAQKEKEMAAKLCAYYDIPHEVIFLPFLKQITRTALVAEEQSIPKVAAEDLDANKMEKTAAQVWVPNRNGLFINIAAAFAESIECKYIIAGLNAEEAKTFPDNSAEFVSVMNRALYYGTLNDVKIICPTQHLNKKEIVELGRQLNIPFQFIWSCYNEGESMCGECESCQRFARACREAGAEDLLEQCFGGKEVYDV